jgi:hypothetical protein
MNKHDWSSSLKEFIQTQRQHIPIPSRDGLSEEEEWHCRIIGGEFMGWYERHLRDILGQRVALRVMKFDPDPLIVFTTTMPGLVAAQEIMPEPSENIVYLLQDEFKAWENEHPVHVFTFHIHHWSCVQQIDQELLPQAQADYPEVSKEEYRIHVTGDLWGEQCGTEGVHLWRWDGQKMELLQEAFSHSVY